MNRTELIQLALNCGATHAAYVDGAEIVLSDSFRDICASNACGNYGRCYMCPPDVGDIHDLINKVRHYRYAVLYQSIHSLEDSYDYEGMVEAGVSHARISQALAKALRELGEADFLHLSAGGCKLCPICAKRENLPCRHPEIAMPSLESYGVDVYSTARTAGLKYVNGQNTVTYFGLVLWNAN